MTLSEDEEPEPVAANSTGSLALDLATGIGGIPRGRVVEVYGPESSGKTTLALQALRPRGDVPTERTELGETSRAPALYAPSRAATAVTAGWRSSSICAVRAFSASPAPSAVGSQAAWPHRGPSRVQSLGRTSRRTSA